MPWIVHIETEEERAEREEIERKSWHALGVFLRWLVIAIVAWAIFVMVLSLFE